MYEGSNPAALRSQEELAAALIALMREEPYGKITITMICQRAQVSRQTFYQMFDGKDDVVRFVIMDEYRAFEEKMRPFEALTFQEFAECTFRFFECRRAVLDLLIAHDLQGLLQEQFQIALGKILSQFRCESDNVFDDENRAFLAGGLCAMAIHRARYGDNLALTARAERFARLFAIRVFVRVASAGCRGKSPCGTGR